MKASTEFEVIIIGGRYTGLSAALTLGRSLRQVLILDSIKPCNRQTPHSHNFLTQDGETPLATQDKAKKQVLNYPTIHYLEASAVKATKTKHYLTLKRSRAMYFLLKNYFSRPALLISCPI